jgi:hypothetical protein
MINKTEVEQVKDFIVNRLASSRIEAISGKNDQQVRLLISGECIAYASILEVIDQLTNQSD